MPLTGLFILNRAYGYHKKISGYVNKTAISFSVPFASGALMSTTGDMLKWQNALNQNLLINVQETQKAFSTYKLNGGESFGYGYGWHIRNIGKIPSREHGGSIFGFNTMAVYIPSEGIYLIGMSNCDCNSPTKVTAEIAALALRQLGKKAPGAQEPDLTLSYPPTLILRQYISTQFKIQHSNFTMKKTFSICLFFVTIGLHSTYAQEMPCTDSVALKDKLKSIMDNDQKIRAKIRQEMPSQNAAKLKEMALEMQLSDKQNQLFVASLLDRCGWPNGLNSMENHTLFLVIDHADTAFMRKYLPLLVEQAQLGNVAKSDLATLQDRIQLRSGKKQLYGTQTFRIGSIVNIWPVEDAGGLEVRRRSMGLPPMVDYITTLESNYKSKVVWDKELSAEQANEKMYKKN